MFLMSKEPVYGTGVLSDSLDGATWWQRRICPDKPADLYRKGVLSESLVSGLFASHAPANWYGTGGEV